MGERMPEPAAEAAAAVEHGEDRAFALVALSVCALSGFVIGLLVQGGLLQGLLTLALTTLAALLGWWMRGVL